jgi:hypothetical protein
MNNLSFRMEGIEARQDMKELRDSQRGDSQQSQRGASQHAGSRYGETQHGGSQLQGGQRDSRNDRHYEASRKFTQGPGAKIKFVNHSRPPTLPPQGRPSQYPDVRYEAVHESHVWRPQAGRSNRSYRQEQYRNASGFFEATAVARDNPDNRAREPVFRREPILYRDSGRGPDPRRESAASPGPRALGRWVGGKYHGYAESAGGRTGRSGRHDNVDQRPGGR